MSESEFLIEELKKVKLVGLDINPYENANIQLLQLDVNLIFPSAFYVLEENLGKIENLYQELLVKGINIFSLNKVVTNEGFNIAPPILEIFENKITIVDGQHRVFLARKLNISFVNSLIISNPSAPLAVTPLSWEQVKIEKSVPQLKRIYNPVIESGKHSLYYRDFSLFGSTGERKLTSES